MKSKETEKNSRGSIRTLLLILLTAVLAGFLICGQAFAQADNAADAPSIFDDTDKGAANNSTQGTNSDSAAAADNTAQNTDNADNSSDTPAATDPKDDGAAAKDDGITNEVRMSTNGTFELHVQNADLLDVLKHLSEQGRINIIVSKDITGKVTLNLFGVSLMEAIEAVLRSNNLCYRKEGNFVYVYTAKEYEEARKLAFKVFRLSYIQADDAQKLLSAILSEKGKITTTPPIRQGIIVPAADIADQGGGMSHAADEIIVVQDYEDVIKKAEEIIKSIDIMPQQVLIEATILTAELGEDTSLGVNIQALSGASMGAFGATTDLTNVNFNNAAVDSLSGNTKGRLNMPFGAQVADGASPMSIGFIYNNTAVFIEMLEKITNTSVVANPKMLVVNKQRGDILIGKEEGYLTTTVSETVATQTVEFLETGTNLQVRPFIGKDGFIRLEIHPEVSEGAVRILTGASADSPALPTKTTTKLTTNVIIRDGHTVVIGGLFRDRVKTQRSQTPILGDLPYVGAAFRSTYDQSVREEIIILLTPHLVRQTKYEQFSEQIKDEIERGRVGMRNSIQWFARSRIADAYINKAKKFLRENRQDKAMWYLDLALSIEPQEESAIKLKEEITGTPYWASVPRFSSTQQFVERAIMCDLSLSPDSVQYPTKPLDTSKIPAKARQRLGIDASLDKRMDPVFIEKTYGNPANDVPQPQQQSTNTVSPAKSVRAVSTPAPAASVQQPAKPVKAVYVKPVVAPVAAKAAVQTPAVRRQVVAPAPVVRRPAAVAPVVVPAPTRASVNTNTSAAAPKAQPQMQSLMPQRQIKLETSPILADPKPVSLQPEVKNLSAQKTVTPERKPAAESQTTEKSENKNWSVWVLWDEETPLSKAE